MSHLNMQLLEDKQCREGGVEESVTRFGIYTCNFDLCTCQEKRNIIFVNYRNEFPVHSIGLGKSKGQRRVKSSS